MKFKPLAPVVLPAFILGLAIGTLLWHPFVRGYFSEYQANLNKIGATMRIVHDRYIDEEEASYEDLTDDAIAAIQEGERHSTEDVSYEALAKDALSAIVDRDRHSWYMPTEAFDKFRMHSKQQYFGIGVGFTIHRVDQDVVITRVFPGGGAEAAGAQPGDRILAVDGKELAQSLDLGNRDRILEIKQLIMGESGTKVTLQLKDEQGGLRDVEIVRGRVQLPSVDDVRLIDRVGYLRIDQFTENTGEEFATALEVLKRGKMNFLVIDLRDNLGGLLPAAIDVLGHFFEEGEPVVYVKGREGEQVHYSAGKTKVSCPVLVLINEYSASSSEIVAGALQVTGKANLIGASSFGKTTVQSVFDFKDDTGMKLTIARYFLPGREPIGEDGLVPDFEVSCDKETRDNLAFQRGQSLDLSDEAFEKRFGFARVKDPQLQAALRVVRGEPIEEVEKQKVESAEP